MAVEYYQDDLQLVEILSDEQELELYHQMKAGDVQARNKLVEGVLRIVFSICKKHTYDHNFEDVLSEINIRVIELVENNWNPTGQGAPLVPYIKTCVANEIKKILWQSQHNGVYLPLRTLKQLKELEGGKDLKEVSSRPKRQQELLSALAAKNMSSIHVKYDDDEEGNIEIKDRERSLPEGFCLGDVEKAMRHQLSGDDKVIFRMFWGLGKTIEHSKSEIAEKLKITVSDVTKSLNKSVKKVVRIRRCKFCDTPFIKDFYNRAYCQRECYHAYRTAQKEFVDCKWCGKRFFRKKKGDKYCGRECYESAKHARWERDHKVRGRHSNVCEWCGKEFKMNRSNHTYCSKKCGNEASYHRTQAGKFIETEEGRKYIRECVQCGQEFLAHPFATRGVGGRFCSEECQSKYLYVGKKCKNCGKLFYPKNKTFMFCTYDCSTEYKRKHTKLPEKRCVMCGETFKPKRQDQQCCKKLCSVRLTAKKKAMKRQKEEMLAGMLL